MDSFIEHMHQSQATILSEIQQKRQQKQKMLAVLLDPDKVDPAQAEAQLHMLNAHQVDLLLVGGSLVQDQSIHQLVRALKPLAEMPIVLFPGSIHQVTEDADGILLLSLISGRNADLLIGKHVEAAPMLKASGIEVLPTGYMLIESGKLTTVNYISHTLPIPHDKPGIAVSTALAGELLGLQLIYMDGGSGAQQAISARMIQEVARQLSIPLIIGGGIRSKEQALTAWEAGADIIVVGSAIEQDPEGGLIQDLVEVRNKVNSLRVT
ncbi:MAG: geranylgeranylglyceryl/heptaprenylglyceryl phosphate synthase [Bacteroidota bacterium]